MGKYQGFFEILMITLISSNKPGYIKLCETLYLGNNGTSNGDTYLYHETNQSYTDGPTLPNHNYKGSCTAFASKSHGYRPVVVYVPDSHSTIYLWDYTMSNNWETCKYTVYLHNRVATYVVDHESLLTQ